MFELDSQRTHVNTSPEMVVDIYTSINQSTVAPPGRTPEPAQAYIATVYESGAYSVYIFLHLTRSNQGLLYAWSEGGAPPDKVNDIFQSALEFTESMGFMMDDMRYRDKSAEEKAQTFQDVPMFFADLAPFRGQMEQGEEESPAEGDLVIESLEEGPEVEDAQELNLDALGDEVELSPGGEGPGVPDENEINLGGDLSPEDEEDAVLDALEQGPGRPAPEPAAEQINLDEDEGPGEETLEAPPMPGAVTEEETLTPEEKEILGALDEAGQQPEQDIEEVMMGDLEEEAPQPGSSQAAEDSEEEFSIDLEEDEEEQEPEAPAPEPGPPGMESKLQVPEPPSKEPQKAEPQRAAEGVEPEDTDYYILVRLLAGM